MIKMTVKLTRDKARRLVKQHEARTASKVSQKFCKIVKAHEGPWPLEIELQQGEYRSIFEKKAEKKPAKKATKKATKKRKK